MPRRRLGAVAVLAPACAGPEVVLAQAIGRAPGVEVAFVDDAPSFNGVVDAIAQGRADTGISRLSQTCTRLMRVRSSEPCTTLRHALWSEPAAVAACSEGRPPEEALRNFNGRIGVIRGSSHVDFGRRSFPAAAVVELADWNAATEGLLPTMGGNARVMPSVSRVHRVLNEASLCPSPVARSMHTAASP